MEIDRPHELISVTPPSILPDRLALDGLKSQNSENQKFFPWDESTYIHKQKHASLIGRNIGQQKCE